MKYIKKVFIGLVSIGLTCILSSCSFAENYFVGEEFGFENLWNRNDESSEEISYKEPSKIEVSDYYKTNGDVTFERDLSEEEVELYNLICYYIEDYQLTFTFEGYDEQSVINAYKAVIDDHPEYFWFNKGYSYQKTTSLNYIKVDFTPNVNGSTEGIEEKDAELKKIVDDVVKRAEEQESLYDKVLFVHDYIVENTVYDTEAVNAPDRESSSFAYSSTSYGCLVRGKAVCSGYSEAFQLLMHKLGIPCGLVTGHSMISGESHEWNYVTLDNYNYQIDVTWDNPSISMPDGEYSQRKSYDYFLITTEEMKLTHLFDSDQNIPECSGLEYNYYIYNNLYFEEYDFGYIAYVFNEHQDEESVSVKFANSYQLDRAVEDLIENHRIFELPSINGSVRYIKSSNGLVLTVFL